MNLNIHFETPPVLTTLDFVNFRFPLLRPINTEYSPRTSLPTKWVETNRVRKPGKREQRKGKVMHKRCAPDKKNTMRKIIYML